MDAGHHRPNGTAGDIADARQARTALDAAVARCQRSASRAVFGKRFSALVGQGALGYLTAWRMHIAAGLLLNNAGPIVSIAEQVGYRSEAAFTTAFKRAFSMSPSAYRQATD